MSTAKRHPSSLTGGALIQISAGATAGIVWFCGIYGTLLPCPGVTSSWSTGPVPAGFSVDYSSPTTFSSGATTEVIVVSPNTAPGLYTLYSCLTNSYNSLGATICAPFIVNVVSSTPPPETIEPSPGFSVELEDGIPYTPGPNSQPIPTQGHLYIQVFMNGIPTASALEAGPVGPVTSAKLEIQNYSQFPFSDPEVDITPYVTQAKLYQAYNTYLANQRNGNVPGYYVATLNSNSWADGLLLTCGVPQTTINTWVLKLEASGRIPTAWQNGSQLVPQFTTVSPPVRHPLIPTS